MPIRGGQTVDDAGRPLMVRDSHSASNNFGLGGSSFTAAPKTKFMFFARFYRGNMEQASQWERGLGFMVKTVDRPKIQFENQTLVQYNKKRIVQTKVEYQPINIRLHDTIDGKAMSMFQDYFSFYYGDPSHAGSGADNPDWLSDVVSGEFTNPGTWGFVPPKGSTSNSYFFSKIEIFQIYGGKYSQFDIIHPKLASFDPDELDYANTNTPSEISVQFNYEGIVFRAEGVDLTEDHIADFGLDATGFYETGDRAFNIPSPLNNLLNPGLIASLPSGVQSALADIGQFANAGSALNEVLSGNREISFGSALQSVTQGAFLFGNNSSNVPISTGVNRVAQTLVNTGSRGGSVNAIATTVLRGLGVLRR
jgi:hypothetical protein